MGEKLIYSEKHRLKNECHILFDSLWKFLPFKTRKGFRSLYYEALAKRLGIPEKECHFRDMDEPTLEKALTILQKGLTL